MPNINIDSLSFKLNLNLGQTGTKICHNNDAQENTNQNRSFFQS